MYIFKTRLQKKMWIIKILKINNIKEVSDLDGYTVKP